MVFLRIATTKCERHISYFEVVAHRILWALNLSSDAIHPGFSENNSSKNENSRAVHFCLFKFHTAFPSATVSARRGFQAETWMYNNKTNKFKYLRALQLNKNCIFRKRLAFHWFVSLLLNECHTPMIFCIGIVIRLVLF